MIRKGENWGKKQNVLNRPWVLKEKPLVGSRWTDNDDMMIMGIDYIVPNSVVGLIFLFSGQINYNMTRFFL